MASRDQARADEYARDNSIERAYGGYDALLNDPDVEAVGASQIELGVGVGRIEFPGDGGGRR